MTQPERAGKGWEQRGAGCGATRARCVEVAGFQGDAEVPLAGPYQGVSSHVR